MAQQALRRSSGERIFIAVIGLIFAGQFGLAWSYPSDPRLFPMIIAAAGMLLALVLLFGPSGSAQPAREREEPTAAHRTTLALVVPPLYALGLWALGFWIITVITIPAVAYLLGYRNRVAIVLVTIAMALAVGLLFPLVNVTMPKSALFGQYLFF